MEDGHAKTADEVIQFFQVDPERGLSLDQVKRYQEKYGPNGKFNYKNFYYNLNFYLLLKQSRSFLVLRL